jgi:serine phosphatase RsbU (regulator of sigma subunit)
MDVLSDSAQSSQADANLLSQELFLSAVVQEVTRVMLSAENLPRTLHTFLLGIGEIAGQRGMAIFRLEKGFLELETHFGPGLRQKLKEFRPKAGAGPSELCMREGVHQLVDRPDPKDPFSVLGDGRYLLVPLMVGSAGMGLESNKRCLGLLWLDAGEEAPPLTGQGLSHLLSLSQLAALRMENFRIHRELERVNRGLQKANGKLELSNHRLNLAQKRIEEDLNRARVIQDSLLPRQLPQGKFRDLASRYIPAGKVGGDYWDCFELPGDRLGLVVADVSGHGISAALVMTMFKILLKTFAMSCDSPAEVLQRINTTFLKEISGGRHFVTAFYAVYDLNTKRMVWTNAGHLSQIALLPQEAVGAATSIEHPVEVESWDNANPMAEMNSVGLVIGVFDQTMLTDRVLDLPQGSRLLLFTDGIVEAHNPEGKMFGPNRMKRLALSEQGRGAEDMAAFLMKEWRTHLGPTLKGSEPDETADDATLVILDL